MRTRIQKPSFTQLIIAIPVLVTLVATMLFGATAPTQAQSPQGVDLVKCPWMDTTKTPEERANLLLAASTLQQKMRWLNEQASAAPTQTTWSGGVTYPAQVPCTPVIQYTDGPTSISGAPGTVTAFSSQTTLASTWDTVLARLKGKAYGYEAFMEHRNVALAPGLLSERTPVSGRTSEYLGEDSLLGGRMAAQMLKGMQLDNPDQPVEGQLKHYVANEQETDRNNSSSNVDQRALHEIYALPFEVAINEGNPGSVMCSYNQVNGIWACENGNVMNEILKQDIGFKGWIVSDFGSVHSTSPSLNGGMDQELNRPNYYSPARLAAALAAGEITEAQINEAAYRVVRAHFAAGLFDVPLPTTPAANASTPAAQAVGLKVSEEGSVLLKNQDGILPLSNPSHKLRIAVVGPTASNTPTGGISAASVCGPTMPGTPCTPIAPLDAITSRAALDGDTVVFDNGSNLDTAAATAAANNIAIVFGYYQEGEGSDVATLSLSPQTNTTLFAAADAGATTLLLPSFSNLAVGSNLVIDTGANKESVQVTAMGRVATSTTLAFAAAAGDTNIKVPSVGGLIAGDQIAIDTGSSLETVTVTTIGTAGATTVRTATAAGATSIPVSSVSGFTAGDSITIDSGGNLETRTIQSVSSGWGGASIRVTAALTNAHAVGVQVSGSGVTFTPALASAHTSGAAVKSPGTGITVSPAVSKAHASGAAVFASYGDDLIRAVADANPNTIVVLQTGGPIYMPWIDSVKAVLENWYGGQSMGTAIAELLWGDVNPSGRLSITFPKSADDLPTANNPAQYPGLVNGSPTRPTGDTSVRQVEYTESLQVGYRWYDAQNIEPLFAFGYGMSYGGNFNYTKLSVEPRNGGIQVSFTVTNAGTQTATDVPQLYVGLPSGLGEPPKRLVGWERITLDPGESQVVSLTIDPNTADHPLSYWSTTADQWVTPYAQTYTVSVGSSARSIQLSKSIALYPQQYFLSTIFGK
jgi:beta-glucosidase-like glycosyl hydrolase